ncbi:microfibril-associated glycoprotein 4-like [Colius striatus]|uniref:microfibril-associated glycoprotein 4-like n=1 Tax=Colius striatus TaxID=57412 RepID=UPI002B1DDE1F|nr:microfibril-associated glycoprotein 4-like [Colius striatus]
MEAGALAVLWVLVAVGWGQPIAPQVPPPCLPPLPPRDCQDVHAGGGRGDGVYLIYPGGAGGRPVPVYCDMTTLGHVWTVFQRRFNGSVSFFRGWSDYRDGFGRADGEYWLGLQWLHLLTPIAPLTPHCPPLPS